MQLAYSTACPDWETRIVAGDSLVPFEPLFPDEAEAALAVFKSLLIVDVAGRPTFGEACEQWVFDFVAAIFGAYETETAKRHINEFLLLISKKNGKSTIAAGIMITALIRNWRHLAELIILAPTLEAANNSYKPAAEMVRADPELSDLLHIRDHKRLIEHRVTKATLQVIAADSDTVSGKKAGFILVDELWLFGKRANASSMFMEAMGGLISRPEGFVVYITTHSDEPPAGVWKNKLSYFRDVRDGKIVDNSTLGVLYEFPAEMVENELYLKPEYFHISNPNIGRSVSRDWLEGKIHKLNSGDTSKADWQVWLSKHLNIQIGGKLLDGSWAGADYWSRGDDPTLNLRTVIDRSELCIVGIDNGGADDLLGFNVLGREADTGIWLSWSHAFSIPEGLERRKGNASLYEDFMSDGDFTVAKDQSELSDRVAGLTRLVKDSGKLYCVSVDGHKASPLQNAMSQVDVSEENGLLMPAAQGGHLTNAIISLELRIIDYMFMHDASALMRWCVGNAKIHRADTSIRVKKSEIGAGKIDPFMALLNSAAFMSLDPEIEEQGSYLDEAEMVYI